MSLVALCTVLVFPFGIGDITLPMENGFVPVELDRQKQYLLADSGSRAVFVVYKEWYEKTYGKGSCLRLKSGCYSSAIDFESWGKQRCFTTQFGDGTKVTFIMHEGSLSIGGRVVDRVSFGLIIGYDAGTYGEKPHGIFGLALPSLGGPTPLMYQLYYTRIISQLAFSVCISGPNDGMTGSLTLGGRGGCDVKRSKTVKLARLPNDGSGLLGTNLGTLSVLRGDTMWMIPVNSATVFDTGDALIRLPLFLFHKLMEHIHKLMEVYRENGLVLIHEGIIHKMPVLQFQLGKSPDNMCIPLYPIDYTESYSARYRTLSIEATESEKVHFGKPFFQAYFIYFDFDESKVAVASYRQQRYSREQECHSRSAVWGQLSSSLLP